jgi:glutamyl-tRNA reductase
MKPYPDESYESWADRVRMFEHGAALQSIAQGEDIAVVMERMSRKIMDKLLHPMYKAINAKTSTYDQERARKEYQDRYINRIPRAADHIEDDIT